MNVDPFRLLFKFLYPGCLPRSLGGVPVSIMPPRTQNNYKICLVGNSTVGKSCLAARLVHNTFHEQTTSTVGSAYLHKDVTINGDTIKLNIWDTAGQERFRALAPLYYRDASGIVLVYDITNEKSFESLRTVWVPALRACTKSDLALAVVGNKLDLEDRERIVSAEEARGYAEILDAVFLETSAKTGSNVETIFIQLATKMMNNKQANDTVDSRPQSVIKLPGNSRNADERLPGSASANGGANAPDAATAGQEEKKKSTCKCN